MVYYILHGLRNLCFCTLCRIYAGVAEWQTRATQNREGNRGGSSPFTGTIKYLQRYGGVLKWQNAKFVIRQRLSVFRYLTLTEDRTEHGSLTSKRLELL